jgi:hypothetical protein
MLLEQIVAHIRNRSYMSGIEREKSRVKATGEVFTPTPVVQKILTKLPPDSFTDITKTFLDPSCGDGQFLGEILIRKMENGSTFEQALSTIYGVDIMIDNVDLCRERLLCGRQDLRHIVEKNIQCRDGLKFGYNFNPMSPARRLAEEKARLKQHRRDLKLKKEEEARCTKLKQEKQEKKLFGQALA